jgi:LacI family transcriptional regulator
MPGRPTQSDVARVAGVSQTVVSHVLNGKQPKSMTQATRERVLEAMNELGYVPDQTAQSLRLRRTMTIAAVIPDIVNPFYGLLVRGIQDEARQHGYDLLTYNTDGHRDLELKALNVAMSGRVDGLVGTTFHLDAADFAPLLSRGVPIALLGGQVQFEAAQDQPIDIVSIPDDSAARMMVEHLVDRGHTHIAIIAGEPDTPPRFNRERGYRRALSGHGIPIDETLIRGGDFTERGGYEGMLSLLGLDPRPTAVFAANDLIAIGALMACRERGITVPDDIAIGGFDDIPAASLVYPPLTTVSQRNQTTGRQLVRLLTDRLRGSYTGPVRTFENGYDLIVRHST